MSLWLRWDLSSLALRYHATKVTFLQDTDCVGSRQRKYVGWELHPVYGILHSGYRLRAENEKGCKHRTGSQNVWIFVLLCQALVGCHKQETQCWTVSTAEPASLAELTAAAKSQVWTGAAIYFRVDLKCQGRWHYRKFSDMIFELQQTALTVVINWHPVSLLQHLVSTFQPSVPHNARCSLAFGLTSLCSVAVLIPFYILHSPAVNLWWDAKN